jgi:hypothetical protein
MLISSFSFLKELEASATSQFGMPLAYARGSVAHHLCGGILVKAEQ